MQQPCRRHSCTEREPGHSKRRGCKSFGPLSERCFAAWWLARDNAEEKQERKEEKQKQGKRKRSRAAGEKMKKRKRYPQRKRRRKRRRKKTVRKRPLRWRSWNPRTNGRRV